MRIHRVGVTAANIGLSIAGLCIIFVVCTLSGIHIVSEVQSVQYIGIPGLTLILAGVFLDMYMKNRPLSERNLTILHWYARFCSTAQDLLSSNPHPTLQEALRVEKVCRKSRR